MDIALIHAGLGYLVWFVYLYGCVPALLCIATLMMETRVIILWISKTVYPCIHTVSRI